MGTPLSETERASLLTRQVTFQRDIPVTAAANPQTSSTASGDELQAIKGLAKAAWGTKLVANNRVSESLDYEPAQNKIFYDRMKTREKKKKSIFGWVDWRQLKCLVRAGRCQQPIETLRRSAAGCQRAVAATAQRLQPSIAR